jgi:linearmycin/streptolysin S transport system ATP-binding protein
LKMVGLSDRKNDNIRTYSGGMKRRINIASSILHQPQILLMDEPTVGVDPQSRNHIFEIVERLNKDGMTIIYTTHYMEEAERLCDTIAIIDSGRIIAKGNLQELRKISGVKDLLTLKISNIDDSIISQLNNSIKFTVKLEEMVLEVECEQIANEISGIINTVQNAGGKIESIDTHKTNLESIFLKLTGKQLRD